MEGGIRDLHSHFVSGITANHMSDSFITTWMVQCPCICLYDIAIENKDHSPVSYQPLDLSPRQRRIRPHGHHSSSIIPESPTPNALLHNEQ